ncbi:hypothetical protein [uncultured Litoreibacter sp.]|nr:hypothetical protein [uncultured Litoreibacter sp.]
MTDKIAFVLAALIIGLFAADIFVFEWDIHVFLGRKLVQLTDYMAFWR